MPEPSGQVSENPKPQESMNSGEPGCTVKFICWPWSVVPDQLPVCWAQTGDWLASTRTATRTTNGAAFCPILMGALLPLETLVPVGVCHGRGPRREPAAPQRRHAALTRPTRAD